MKLRIKSLPVLIATVVLGLPNAFAVDGKTWCIDVEIPGGGSVTITLSPTEEPGVLRGDDGSWWWEPSNGEQPFQLPPPETKPNGDPKPKDGPKPDGKPKPEGDPKPEDDSDAEESTAGSSQDYDEETSMDVDLLLIEFLMEEGCSLEEAIEAVELANASSGRVGARRRGYPRPSKIERPVFGPHIVTFDGLWND